MKIVILGGDGYLGWPTAMHFANQGHDVIVVDDYIKRRIEGRYDARPLVAVPRLTERCKLFQEETGKRIEMREFNCRTFSELRILLSQVKPDAIVHYAELPSAPFSMLGYEQALSTMENNLGVTLALAHAVIEVCPEAHIIKLGTMGEYGTPNAKIREGWLDYEKDGRAHRFLYPAEPGSLYHVTKVQDTHLLWLYTKTHRLRVTDIMQGPVYGMTTPETALSAGLGTSFHYDDLFGTVINRFVTQVVAGVRPTIYGTGGQTRGFIHLRDVLRGIELIASNPPDPGDLRIFNQITAVHRVADLAELVCSVAQEISLGHLCPEHIDNPRREAEEHFYEVDADGLKALGLEPIPLGYQTIAELIEAILPRKDAINPEVINPRYSWRT